MSEPLTYAKVDGPPDDWWGLLTLNLDTGEYMELVREVDAQAGWLIRYRTDENGAMFLENGEVATERVEGRFALIRHPRYAK